MLMVIALLPVVSENLPKILGSFRFFWAPLWLLSLLIFKGRLFLKPDIVRFLIYGIIMAVLIPTLWYNMDDWLIKNLREEFYWMITFLTVIYYFLYFKDYYGLALITKWSLIFIGITACLSIVASFINPMYARLLTQAISGFRYTREGIFFVRMGAGQYSFGQALICLFPLLIYYYKWGKVQLFPRWVILLYIVIIFVAVVRMQFFSNIIISTIVIIISLLGSKRIKVSIFILVIFLGFLLILPKTFYSTILLNVSSYFEEGSENYTKSLDVAEYLEGENAEKSKTAGRLERYPMLIEAVMNNPVFGNAALENPSEIGAGYHLHWMGKLGATGLFGLLLFFFPHFYFIKSILKQFDEKYIFFASISFLAFFTLGFIKTISGRDIWFSYFFLITGIYYLPYLKIKKGFSTHISKT